jgi:hypothetical protein
MERGIMRRFFEIEGAGSKRRTQARKNCGGDGKASSRRDIGDQWRVHDFAPVLERTGANYVVASRLYEKHPPRLEYFLTDKGKALGPVLKALYAWGEKYGGAVDKEARA